MGRKNVVKSYAMIPVGDMSGSIVSDTVNVINLDKASIHVDWSGATIDGMLFVDARNGEQDTWYELDFNVDLVVDTDTGNHQIIFNELPMTDIRLRYEPTTGTGNLTALITLKVVGA